MWVVEDRGFVDSGALLQDPMQFQPDRSQRAERLLRPVCPRQTYSQIRNFLPNPSEGAALLWADKRVMD
jgi:hypothetical protein